MNIYVGNLPYIFTDKDLENLFTPHGQVASARVVIDRETGRGRGFGFVEMPNQSEAQAGMLALSGKEVGGRALTVNESKPRELGRPASRPSGGRGNRW